jgi:hypothetical protein
VRGQQAEGRDVGGGVAERDGAVASRGEEGVQVAGGGFEGGGYGR